MANANDDAPLSREHGSPSAAEETASETGSEGGETETRGRGRRGDREGETASVMGREEEEGVLFVDETAAAAEENGSNEEEEEIGGEEEEEGRAREATERKRKRKTETAKGDETEEEEEERVSSEASASEEEEEEEGEREKTKRHSASKRNNKRKTAKRKAGGRSSRSGSKDTSSSSRRKRKRGGGVTAFLDVEAQEGDDEEEEEGEDVLDFSEEAAQAARLAAQAAERRGGAGAAGAQQQRRGGAGHLETAIDSLVRRYQDQTFEEGEEEEEEDDLLEEDADGFAGDEDASEGILLPDITDPKLWMVKLNKTGVEREVCISILNKSFQQQERGKDIDIFSCYASDDLKGYIYVEAHSQYAIKEALHGLRLVRTHGEIRIVPLEEMPAVFNSVRSQMPCIPQRNDFVRVKRGLYANDVAQIHQVEEQGMVVTVRLIPRVDYNSLLDREKRGEGGRGRKKEEQLALRRGFAGGVMMRVQKRLFDREEIDARGGQVEQGILPGTVRFAGMTFEESGYLLRRMPMRHLLVGSAAAPSLAEVTEFLQGQQGVSAEELREECQRPLSCFLKRRRRAYRLGEAVRIIKGELQGSRGRIGEQQQEAADDEDAEEAMEIVLADKSLGSVMLPISHFVKDLQVGENVRAIGGVNAGHSGLITSIDSDKQTATVFSPTAGHLFTCGLESLTLAPDAALGEEGLSSVRGFHVGDFVELTSGERGVLVFIDKNRTSIRLLLPSNAALAATAAQLAMRRSTDSLTSLDALRLPLEKGSSVVLLLQHSAASSSLTAAAASSRSSSSAGTLLRGSAAAAATPHTTTLSSASAAAAAWDASSLCLSEGTAAAAGRVLHVWRDRVYVRLTGRRENAGIVAVDAKHVRLSGAAAAAGGAAAALFRSPSKYHAAAAAAAREWRGAAAAEGGPASPQQQPPRRAAAAGGLRSATAAAGTAWTARSSSSRPAAATGQHRRNPYLGKLVKILRGRHKGLMATVRRVEYNELRVMLQTKELELKISMGDVQLVESARDYQSLVGRLAATPPPALFPFSSSSDVSAAAFSPMHHAFAAAAGGGGGVLLLEQQQQQQPLLLGLRRRLLLQQALLLPQAALSLLTKTREEQQQ